MMDGRVLCCTRILLFTRERSVAPAEFYWPVRDNVDQSSQMLLANPALFIQARKALLQSTFFQAWALSTTLSR